MTGVSATPARSIAAESGEYMVRADMRATFAEIPSPDSATFRMGRAFDRFGAYVLPVLVSIAAVGAPTPPAVRRIFSGADASRSEIGGVAWLLDDFVYSEELATLEQVRALNALLALPAVEGFTVDLMD